MDQYAVLPHKIGFDRAGHESAISAFEGANALNQGPANLARASLAAAAEAVEHYNAAVDAAQAEFSGRVAANREAYERVVADFTKAESKVNLANEKLAKSREAFNMAVSEAGISPPENPSEVSLNDAIRRVVEERSGVVRKEKQAVTIVPQVPKRQSRFADLLLMILGVVSGLLLGLAFAGPFTGFLNSQDLEQGTVSPLGVFMLILGVGAVYALGQAIEHYVTSNQRIALVTNTLTGKDSKDPTIAVREVQDRAIFAIYALWGIVALAEGYAILTLARENTANLAERGINLGATPGWMLIAFGLVASSPYFFYKRSLAMSKGRELAEAEVAEARAQAAGRVKAEQEANVQKQVAIVKGSKALRPALAMLSGLTAITNEHGRAQANHAALKKRLEDLQTPVQLSEQTTERLSSLRQEFEWQMKRMMGVLAGSEVEDHEEQAISVYAAYNTGVQR